MDCGWSLVWEHFLEKASSLAAPLRWLVNSAVVFFSFLFCFLALEIGIRFLDGVPLFSNINFIAQKLDIVRKTSGVKVDYDPRVGWVQAANLRWVAPVDLNVKTRETYTTGAYGARMPGTGIVPLQQGAILATGDSFLAGSDVPDRDSWPANLEAMLGKQVINLGVGGYGLDQSVLRAEAVVPLLKPRVLIVETRFEFGVLLLNRMSVYGGAPKPYFTVENGKLVLQNDPVPMHASGSKDLGWIRSLLGYSYLADYVMTRLDLRTAWLGQGALNVYSNSTAQALEVGCLLMRRFGQLAADNDARAALVLQYSGPEIMKDSIPWYEDFQRIASCAQKAGVEVVDLLDGFRAVYKERSLQGFQRLWLMSDNNRVYGHMSAEGNALVAKLVAQKLFPNGSADQKSK
jgi:lysophospholipase L1-like esterase